MAAKGYPGAYTKGTAIRNIDRAAAIPGVQLFHAGTARNPDGDLIATGGRTLSISARGPDLRTARDLAYQAVDLIDWPDGFCRRDIGWRGLS
jgi:phosphoribosylamine--glycine ligase